MPILDPIEYERRFLIPISEHREIEGRLSTMLGARAVHVRDVYVFGDEPANGVPLRLRVETPIGALKGTLKTTSELTVKVGADSTKRVQLSYPIPYDALEAWTESMRSTWTRPLMAITKTRLQWTTSRGTKMHYETAHPDIDVSRERAAAQAVASRFAIAEAEFTDSAAMHNFEPPAAWVEISNVKDFSNFELARSGWPTDVQKYPYLAAVPQTAA